MQCINFRMNIIIFTIFTLSIYVSVINGKTKSPEPSFEDLLKNVFEQHKVYKRRIEETHMKAEEVITRHNYSCETYSVTTKDGYILTLHRIPRPKGCFKRRSKRDTPRPPVLLMHGVMASTTNWITNGPLSLAFLLADNDFDVWMGNARGNPYSRMHNNLLPSTMPFWDFSFHEIGKYDLPALIDFILDQTGFPNLHYIGHSQGSTVILILLALLPIYNNRVISAYLLSPVAYMSHMTSPFLILWSILANPIGLFLDVVGYGEFLPNSNIMRTIARLLCKDGDFTKFICTLPIFLITGLNPLNVLPESIPIYVANVGSVSTRQLIHYGQLYTSGHFRPFDFGLIENFPRYRAPHPPDYPLGNIRIPLFMFNSPNDWLANPIDVDRLHREVPTSIVIDIPDPTFTHLDYIIGINAPDLVYFPILWRLRNLTVPLPPLPNFPRPPNPRLPNIPRPPNPRLPNIPGLPPNASFPPVPPPWAPGFPNFPNRAPNPGLPNIPGFPYPSFPNIPPNASFPSLPPPWAPGFPGIPNIPPNRAPNPWWPQNQIPRPWVPGFPRAPYIPPNYTPNPRMPPEGPPRS